MNLLFKNYSLLRKDSYACSYDISRYVWRFIQLSLGVFSYYILEVITWKTWAMCISLGSKKSREISSLLEIIFPSFLQVTLGVGFPSASHRRLELRPSSRCWWTRVPSNDVFSVYWRKTSLILLKLYAITI